MNNALAARVVQGVVGQDRLRAISLGMEMEFYKKSVYVCVRGLDLTVLGQRSVL
jgi:hypothetical protein